MARRAGVSLGTKLVLSTVVLLAATVASGAWYSLTTLQRQEEQIERAGQARQADLQDAINREKLLLVRSAAIAAGNELAKGESDAITQEIAERLKKENEESLVWVMFVRSDGELYAATAGAPFTEHFKVVDDEMATKLRSADAGVVEEVPGEGNQVILGSPSFIPSTSGPVRAGQVRIAVDTSQIERVKKEAQAANDDALARTQEAARQQLIFAGIILLVGILIGTWQSVRITRPLRALSAQARHIASGDFGRRVEVKRGDEVGELGESFNIMAESLGQLVDELTRKAGLEREIEVARSIQGLMTPPPDVMTLGSFKLTGRCEMASACGGDWWSYRTLSDGRLLVVVGDVTGHGMPSAMIAATGRGAVEALAMVDHSTLTAKIVLQAIDRAIRDVGGRRLLMTCFALVISPSGHVSYANAGHTFPYVMRRSGSQVELSILPVRSNPLGSNSPLIATGEHRLSAGDYMILTSDGLTDRVSENGMRFGDKRLRKALVDQVGRSSTDIASLCDRIVLEVNHFGGQQPVDDDITLVVVQYTGTASDSGERRHGQDQSKERAA